MTNLKSAHLDRGPSKNFNSCCAIIYRSKSPAEAGNILQAVGYCSYFHKRWMPDDFV
jgi:hypothetical protein